MNNEKADIIKVLRVKELNLELPPLREGEAICQKNPYIIHAATPEHSCQLEIEEVYMTKEEYFEHLHAQGKK